MAEKRSVVKMLMEGRGGSNDRIPVGSIEDADRTIRRHPELKKTHYYDPVLGALIPRTQRKEADEEAAAMLAEEEQQEKLRQKYRTR